MLFSLALILIIGFALSGLFNRLHIPGLLAMIITGVVLGPYVLNLISPDILNISSDLREIALIVILLRAGLTMDLKDLKSVGRPAILMCFVPALLELLAVVFLAPRLFGISTVEAAILGTIVAAVSPAVVVPRMLKLMESGYGREKRIPHLLMAASSVNTVVAIILFAAFLGIYSGEEFKPISLINVPISIVLGIALGIACGLLLVWVFKRFHMRDTIKVLTILSASFVLVTIEDFVSAWVPVSGILAVMALGGTILKAREPVAKRLTGKFSKIWVGAEVLLFVLVGAQVDITALSNVGLLAVVLLAGAMVLRIAGVYISLIGTELNAKERLYCAITNLPKATVQAAIGGVPLAAGVASGNLILAVAVLSIIITAPIGAVAMDISAERLLTHDG